MEATGIGAAAGAIYAFDEFRLDLQRARLCRGDATIALTPKLFAVLDCLVRNAGRLLDKATLFDSAWPNVVVEESNLAQSIYRLRRALGERPSEHRYIVTVPGRGYRFVADVRTLDGARANGTPANGCAERTYAVTEALARGRHLLARRAPGDLERARAACEDGLAAAPENAELWAALASTVYLQTQGREIDETAGMARVRAAAERAVALDPSLAEPHLRIAFCCRWQKDEARADEYLQRARRLDPDHPLLLALRADDAARTHRFEDAAQLARRALIRDPLDLCMRGKLVCFLLGGGHVAQAEAEARRLAELRTTGDSVDAIGRMRQARGDPRDAERRSARRRKRFNVLSARAQSHVHAEVDQGEVAGVGHHVRRDRRDEIPAGREIQPAEQRALHGGLHDTGLALIDVREPEGDVHPDQRQHPRRRTAARHGRYARQCVAAPDHFLAEARQYQVEREVDRQQLRVADDVGELAQIRMHAEQRVEHRVLDVVLEGPEGDAGGDAHREQPQRSRPQAQAAVAPRAPAYAE